MSETVVHVTTLNQWKSVLDVWFKQGYAWPAGDKEYSINIFENGGRFLFLDDYVTYSKTNPNSKPYIEYSEFMAQQKDDNKMETYYVTKEQLDFLNTTYEAVYSLDELLNSHVEAKNMFDDFSMTEGNAVLRYLGGDTSIEFKVKEQLYRLWRIDDEGDKVYMLLRFGTPTYRMSSEAAFTAPLDEIKKLITPAWHIEEVN